MSDETFDLAEEAGQAWMEFRARLADGIAGLEHDEIFDVDLEVGLDDEELRGAAPYVQLVAWDEELVRAEVSSNEFLDPRFVLTEEQEAALAELGWQSPTYGAHEEPDQGSANFWVDVERREADRLAVMAVAALRDVFGCPHPAFLSAEGVEREAATEAEPAPAGEVAGDEPGIDTPETSDDLQAMVDATLAGMQGEPVTHDSDGDVPLRVGKSALFVKVAPDRPAVDLYAEVVIDIGDVDRAAVEAAILNRTHQLARFHLREDTLVLDHRLLAMPFVPAHLRLAVEIILHDLDEIARDTAARVQGRRFYELPVADQVEGEELEVGQVDPTLTSLLELMSDGRVRAEVAASLYSMSTELIAEQIARLRSGEDEPGDHELDDVVALLRKALRVAAEARTARELRGGAVKLPPKPRSQQLSLLPDPEPGLDGIDAGWTGEGR